MSPVAGVALAASLVRFRGATLIPNCDGHRLGQRLVEPTGQSVDGAYTIRTAPMKAGDQEVVVTLTQERVN